MRHTFFSIITLLTLTGWAAAQTYTYDAAGRLTHVAYPDGRGFSYQYDLSDNMLSAASTTVPLPPVSVVAVRTSAGQVRIEWQAGASSPANFLIMRKLVNGAEWQEIATVSGTTRQFIDTTVDPSLEYVYRVSARDSSGTSAASRDALASSASTIALSVDSRGARSLFTVSGAGSTRTGYANVEVDTGSTPYGTAVFRFTQGGVIVSEAAVPASPPTIASRVFIEYRTGVSSASGLFQGQIDVNTGFAAVNTSTRAAELAFTLRDAAGRIIASGISTLGAGHHFARFISELPSLAPGFSLPADFASTTSFGSLDIVSSEPISVMALRMTINQRGEALFTSTPVSDLSNAPQPGNVEFPQFVDGGGYSTAIVLLNTSDQIQTGKLELRDNDGALFTVKPIGGSSGATFDLSIPPGGLAVFETDGAPTAVRVGWARWIPGANQKSPVGSGVFRVAQGGIVVTESGIPSATPTKRARIYIDKTSGRDTGIAVANPGTATSTITVTAYQMNGSTAVGSATTVTLPANGHDAKLSGELVAALTAGFTGVIELSSESSFSALTLRLLTNSRGELILTTFPVADQNRAAPSPVLFPQIADGGGFETELILLGPVTASSAVVRYFDDQGVPLPVGRLP